MNTLPYPTTARPLHRPWLRRWADDVQVWLAQRRAATLSCADYAALSHLSEETLRDIGAPDWLHEGERGVPVWQLERMRW